MIPPTPGPDPFSRNFGQATPPDGAGPIGPDQLWPTPVTVTHDEFMRGLNPLQHVPILGTLYRVATGQQIPVTMRVLGAGIVGGPLGMLGAGFMGIVEAILTMKPDLSRPAAPAGMSATGSEAGMQPITPGTLGKDEYTTLATTLPEWLDNSPTQLARGNAAYQEAAAEWNRSQALEKGLA